MNNLFDLTGQTALVTGASSGLGVQFAKALANQGAKVALMARRAEKLEQIKAELTATGSEVMTIPGDVTDENSVENAVNQVASTWGKLDIVVNNAGIATGAGKPIDELPANEWEQLMAVNVTGVYLVAKHAARIMKNQNYGRIINIASMYGVVGNNFSPASNYHASKGGVVNFTRALAAELAKSGITVNAIGPGFFASEMTAALIEVEPFVNFVKSACPMARVGKEGELDSALIFLASPASSYVTGQTVCIDGGWTAV